MSTEKKSAASAAKEPKFIKDALVNSKRFCNERDIVSALLEDGKEYTVAEVEGMITKYMKGMVK